MPTNQRVIDLIVRKARVSGRVSIAATHYGQFKVRVRHGPFGLLTSKYVVDSETLEALKRQLKQRFVLSIGASPH